MTSMWDYRADAGFDGQDIVGYNVEATDGGIGKIDESSVAAGKAYMVVDTGFWIFGKKRLIPAGVVQRVDDEARKVYVSLTKDQIKAAPDFDEQSSRHARRIRDLLRHVHPARRSITHRLEGTIQHENANEIMSRPRSRSDCWAEPRSRHPTTHPPHRVIDHRADDHRQRTATVTDRRATTSAAALPAIGSGLRTVKPCVFRGPQRCA